MERQSHHSDHDSPGDLTPLTFQQLTSWRMGKGKGHSSFRVSWTFHLSGKLNSYALKQSLNRLVRDHDALRMNIVVVDGEPFQKIYDASCFQLEVIESLHTADDARSYLQDFAGNPYHRDPAVEPLFAACLLRLTERSHILAVAWDHIVGDGMSTVFLFGKLWTLYQDFATGHDAPLFPRPMQYAAYALWQRSTYPN